MRSAGTAAKHLLRSLFAVERLVLRPEKRKRGRSHLRHRAQAPIPPRVGAGGPTERTLIAPGTLTADELQNKRETHALDSGL